MQQTTETVKPSGLDKRLLWAAGLPVLLTLLFYLPSLRNSFVNWDDPKVILNNPHIRSLSFDSVLWMFTNFYAGFYTPLVLLSHALDYHMGGLNPFIFHLTSLILHLLNTLLVFFVSLKILSIVRKGQADEPAAQAWLAFTAALAAFLFGLHPIHVEPVAWATGRKDLLCGLFFLSSLLVYLGYASAPVQKPSRLYASLFLFVLALLSKPMAVTLPLVLLILDYWPLGRFSSQRSKAVMEKLPYFIAALLFGLATFMAESRLGAVPDFQVFSWDVRIMNAFHSLVFYLAKSLWPVDLMALYPMGGIRAFSLGNLASALAVLLVNWVCFMLRKTRSSLWAAWLYYLVTLAPVLGVIQVGGHAAADRYMYIPSVGPFLLAAAVVTWFFRSKKPILMALVLMLSAAMGWGTMRQARLWKDSITLWKNVVRIPGGDTAISCSNLGDAYREAGRLDDALASYDKAIAINPMRYNSHNGRATVLFNKGRMEEALAGFKTAATLEPNNAIPHFNLGFIYTQKKMTQDAFREIREAIRLDPGFAQAYNNLGVIYGTTGKHRDAQEAFRKAATLDPGNPMFRKNLEASLGSVKP